MGETGNTSMLFTTLDALDCLHCIFGIELHSWSRNLTEKCHFTAVDLVFEVVEYRVKRQQHELVAHFVCQPVLVEHVVRVRRDQIVIEVRMRVPCNRRSCKQDSC